MTGLVAAGVWMAIVGAVSPLEGQRAVGVSVSRWFTDSPAMLYGFGFSNRLVGPLRYGIGLQHADDRGALADRSETSGELSISTARTGGVYPIAAAGLGIRYADGQVRANWSAGVGYAFRLVSGVSMAVEARYRAEDGRARGFWRLQPGDRRAFTIGAHLQLAGGLRVARPVPPVERPGPILPPDETAISEAAGDGVLSEASAAVAVDVVETALSVMGTPYQWGGDGTDGFDCSGLIQYAYGEHGIILPRVSRDQARTGVAVRADVGSLRPGDILTFNASGSGVSHVGLYVGDGQFIHSASSGVRLSSLTNGDGDGAWWRARWVGARRVLQ